MSYTFSVNNTPSTGSNAMYLVVAALTAAGWTQADGSDGAARAAGQVTSGGNGTNGFNNNYAWVRMRAPAVVGGTIPSQTREITIQRGTTSKEWRIKYSASAGFTGGSPSGTVTPTAADDVVMAGTGTDASPTFYNVFPNDGTYRCHIVAGGAAEFYSFVVWGMTTSTTTTVGGFGLDVMATGSFSSLDVDPAVFYVGQQGGATFSDLYGGSTATVTNPVISRAWMGATSAAGVATNTNSVRITATPYGYVLGGGLSIGANPFSGKDDMVPVAWIRGNSGAAPTGWKGFSTLFLWPSVIRANTDTYDVLGTKDRIYINGYSLPWSGATPLI